MVLRVLSTRYPITWNISLNQLKVPLKRSFKEKCLIGASRFLKESSSCSRKSEDFCFWGESCIYKWISFRQLSLFVVKGGSRWSVGWRSYLAAFAEPHHDSGEPSPKRAEVRLQRAPVVESTSLCLLPEAQGDKRCSLVRMLLFLLVNGVDCK
jgi:hypothetical protein